MPETSTKSTDSSTMMDDIFKLSPSQRFSRIHFSNDETTFQIYEFLLSTINSSSIH
jgi:hypothetical protein